MQVPRSPFAREKLINAIIYFAKETKHCQKTKLFKLLAFLDFEIYSHTGRAVTGLPYSAWPMGPVPVPLFKELDRPAPDLAKHVLIRKAEPDLDSLGGMIIKPKLAFDPKWFTKRELVAMERLAEIYKDATGQQMVLVSHDRGGPWDRVWNVEGRHQAEIPYRYALSAPDSISESEADEIEREAEEVRQILAE